MKKKYFQGFFLFLALGLASCKETAINPTNTSTTSTSAVKTYTTEEVNAWVYDSMKEWYLWTDNMPAKANTNLSLPTGKDGEYDPKSYYFYSILNNYPTTDRFSWLNENVTDLTNSLTGVSKAYGFSRSAVYLDATNTNVGFFVSYVIKDSPAEKAGLKRGDIIMTVNGSAITADNFQTLISNGETATFALGEKKDDKYVLTGKTLTATKAEIHKNPVHFTKIFEKQNKKIGYLVYTQFLSEYDSYLKQAFAEFKAAGVNELVLDLRINGGGYISSADVLSSLIVKNLNTENVIHRDEWNANITKKYPAYTTPTKFSNQANNLGTLNRLFVLTSTGTASASELIINSLRPYMEVILVGEHTHGKNVGSITLKDGVSPARWAWGLQPIVLKTVNSLGESNYGTEMGFMPDYQVSDPIPYVDWGNETDPLLAKAISIITGNTVKLRAKNSYTELKNSQVLQLNFAENPADNRKEMFVTFPK